MYNEQLEQLIDAALADGVLTEKEKQILFKKAQAIGVDLDEFEMVLDARLVKIKKAEAEKAASSAPKSNKLGDVKKCPACGAIVQSFIGVCSECGYAFEEIDANKTSQKFAKEIEKINSMYDDRIARADNVAGQGFNVKWQEKKNKETALSHAVKTFPIPNTKSDLFEFLTILQTYMFDISTPFTVADAYMTKYTECIIKAKFLFPNDQIFTNLINEQQNVKKEYEKIHKKHPKLGMKTGIKIAIGVILVYVVIMIIVGILAYLQENGIIE
ncbi:MAG: hypothetical protein II945_07755 [Bacteroidales bacterium]|nr:hypothetical protein [Bacteroidales bacterium]